jgi:hypothetical protein
MNLSPPIEPAPTLLSAPLELAGNWGNMVPESAQLVLERMRRCCLDGVSLISDRQPTRLRVDEHKSGPPAIWLHPDGSTMAWTRPRKLRPIVERGSQSGAQRRAAPAVTIKQTRLSANNQTTHDARRRSMEAHDWVWLGNKFAEGALLIDGHLTDLARASAIEGFLPASLCHGPCGRNLKAIAATGGSRVVE